MRRIMRYFVVAAMVTLLCGGSTALAKDKDKTRGPRDRPSGWEQGEKTGWEGQLPPGLEKKVDEEDGVKEKKKEKKKKKDKKKKVKKKKDGVDEEVEEEELKESGEEEEGEVKQEEEGLKENAQEPENMEKETVKGSEKAVGKKRGLRERFKRFFGGGEE
jgi:hypothetical protein